MFGTHEALVRSNHTLHFSFVIVIDPSPSGSTSNTCFKQRKILHFIKMQLQVLILSVVALAAGHAAASKKISFV